MYSVLEQIEQATKPLTVAQVASILGMAKVTVYRRAQDGTLPALNTGGTKVLFDPKTLAYWLRRRNPVSVLAAREMKGRE